MIPWRKIREDVEKQLKIYPNPPIVCCSGGQDFMLLLNFMGRMNIPFDVFHFVHGIRDKKESHKDLEVIKNKLNQLDRGITLHVRNGVDLAGPNSEMRCRTQRWGAIGEIIRT